MSTWPSRGRLNQCRASSSIPSLVAASGEARTMRCTERSRRSQSSAWRLEPAGRDDRSRKSIWHETCTKGRGTSVSPTESPVRLYRRTSSCRTKTRRISLWNLPRSGSAARRARSAARVLGWRDPVPGLERKRLVVGQLLSWRYCRILPTS